jgi:hypothetical protein
MPEAIGQRWTIGSEHNQVVGPDLASAATIAPTHSIHAVTGAAAVVNITPPYPTFSGTITLVALGAFTWTAAGNISVASTAAATVGRATRLTYLPATGKWYPDTITS